MSWWKRLANKTRGVFGSQGVAERGSGGEADIQLRQGTAEYEWFVARGELEMNRDLKHGASHLANLLSYDPGNPEWIQLLEDYLAAAGSDPESLIPRGDQLYYTTEAMRAYVWQKQGRRQEALELLIDVVGAKQETRYLEAWALDWLEADGGLESLSEQTGARLFSLVLNRFPEAKHSPLPRLREIQRWARLIERFAPRLPAGELAVMLRAGLLRKAGLFDEALAVVRPSLERSPNWHAATALGLILRQQDKCQQAEAAFRRALELDPTDASARLEAADMYFERDQWQQALAWYENALAAEPQQPWALPSAMFCRWKLTGDDQHIQQVVELARNDPENGRAHELWGLAAFPGIPEPADASANLLRQIREMIENGGDKAPTGEVKLTLSSLEAPSNYLAFRLEMESLGHDLHLLVSVKRVPAPDPRVPIVAGPYVLWTFEGTDASPGLPRPEKDVAGRIAALAAARYDPAADWAAASRVAEALGPGRVGEVLATMVHPPPVPEGKTALAWLPRVQAAAAQVAAQIDGGWEGSVRREALLSVLLGPSDWATGAAIAALGRIGREEEALAPDIHAAFQQLADHLPDGGYCCWERALFEHWLELPHLFDNEREELRKRLREIDARAEANEE